MINLNEATVSGLIVSTLIFIAKKAEPHIADKIINNNKLFKDELCFRS